MSAESGVRTSHQCPSLIAAACTVSRSADPPATSSSLRACPSAERLECHNERITGIFLIRFLLAGPTHLPLPQSFYLNSSRKVFYLSPMPAAVCETNADGAWNLAVLSATTAAFNACCHSTSLCLASFFLFVILQCFSGFKPVMLSFSNFTCEKIIVIIHVLRQVAALPMCARKRVHVREGRRGGGGRVGWGREGNE